jgi:hypothetical protein
MLARYTFRRTFRARRCTTALPVECVGTVYADREWSTYQGDKFCPVFPDIRCFPPSNLE